jgi:hypothetical protein
LDAACIFCKPIDIVAIKRSLAVSSRGFSDLLKFFVLDLSNTLLQVFHEIKGVCDAINLSFLLILEIRSRLIFAVSLSAVTILILSLVS